MAVAKAAEVAEMIQMARAEGKEVEEMAVVREEGVKGQVTAEEMVAVLGVVVVMVVWRRQWWQG